MQEVLHSSNIVRAPLVTLSLGQGILSSDGPYWRGQRRLIQPEFHQNCLLGFGPLMVLCIEAMFERWAVAPGQTRRLDMTREMQVLTPDVVGRALFGADLVARADAICAAIGVLIEDLGAISWTVLNTPYNLSPTRNATFAAALSTVDEAVYALIAERRAQPDAWPRDLLSSLLRARGEDGAALSDVQLRDEIVTMLIAGHETTGVSLAWALHLLAQNPGAMAQLQSEADALGLGERMPTVADLPALAWCEMVFEETLRIYPPVWFMLRRAVEAESIAGVSLAAGASVLVSAYTTHRHPQFWPDPERFDPNRFASGTPKRPLYAHFPFAGGRHLCLGRGFALIEAQLVLSALAARFEWQTLPDPPVVALPVLTLRQKFGVPMQVRGRA